MTFDDLLIKYKLQVIGAAGLQGLPENPKMDELVKVLSEDEALTAIPLEKRESAAKLCAAELVSLYLYPPTPDYGRHSSTDDEEQNQKPIVLQTQVTITAATVNRVNKIS